MESNIRTFIWVRFFVLWTLVNFIIFFEDEQGMSVWGGVVHLIYSFARV